MLAAEANAVITAAGLSSRMGFPKALLDWRGRPLLQYQMDMLQGLGKIVVVLGHDAPRIRLGVSLPAGAAVVENPEYQSGRASSIRCGLAAADPFTRAILICGVDQPLDREVIDTLIAAFDPEQFAYAVPVFEGRRGHPVLFSARVRRELARIDEAGEGLRAVVRKHREHSLAVPVTTAAVLRNLNSPEDLAEPPAGPG